MKKWLLVIAVFLPLMFSGCTSSVKTSGMSDTFVLGDGTWMIRRAECSTMLSSRNGDLAVDTLDNYLVRVRGFIWNQSPAPLPIDQELVLVDRGGIQYDPHPQSILATYPIDISTTKVVQPGSRVEFACAFEVPNNVNGIQLMIRSPKGLHPSHRVKLSVILVRQ